MFRPVAREGPVAKVEPAAQVGLGSVARSGCVGDSQWGGGRFSINEDPTT